MSPQDHYLERLRSRESRLNRFDRLHQRVALGRLTIAGVFVLLAWACSRPHPPSSLWLLLPAACFIALVTYHQRIGRLRDRARRAVVFYHAALARLRGDQAATGLTGDAFNDEHHLYGGDLDLFGKRSLYELLCTARTPMGEELLARWLLNPASVQIIGERQLCIAELRGRLDLREDLALLGGAPRIKMHPHALKEWTEAPDELAVPWLRGTALALTLSACGAAILWAVQGIAWPFLGVLSLAGVLNQCFRRRVQRCVAGLEGAYEDINLLAVLLRRIEGEAFENPVLRALQRKLSAHSLTASVTLSRLATLVNFVEARRNPFLAPLMLPLLYAIQSALAAERWRQCHGRRVAAWLEVLAEFEALQCLANYSFERPADPFPEFLQGPAAFSAAALGHPLIPAARRIGNDVEITGTARILLVSGSNMSGKSTLLRSVGMNIVLAMAGAPVCAAHLKLTPLQVGANIRINDSLHEGSSRFYAEITRLRQLFEPSTLPLLFLLDELLQGTNSNDRLMGARGVLLALLDQGSIGLISTHDLALADVGGLPTGSMRNVHFQDELHDGRLAFDFKLRDGLVTKSNGIELMRAIGLAV